ncbi:uncharacterized protein ARMOST_18181 [Armillaria ostoyae]|uniref:Uncharacterized protein n=1 Tax=Armillaria ostoyae TaxID=47428 RepID=A0A284S142_ARMOS|nr:uncharacterized protein ARMOST_18181 [Armillaria ostoyae]
MSTNVSSTYGAVTIGALSASLLSGAVAIQTILYYKLYPSDSIRVKTLVSPAPAVIRLTLSALTGLRHMVRAPIHHSDSSLNYTSTGYSTYSTPASSGCRYGT